MHADRGARSPSIPGTPPRPPARRAGRRRSGCARHPGRPAPPQVRARGAPPTSRPARPARQRAPRRSPDRVAGGTRRTTGARRPQRRSAGRTDRAGWSTSAPSEDHDRVIQTLSSDTDVTRSMAGRPATARANPGGNPPGTQARNVAGASGSVPGGVGAFDVSAGVSATCSPRLCTANVSVAPRTRPTTSPASTFGTFLTGSAPPRASGAPTRGRACSRGRRRPGARGTRRRRSIRACRRPGVQRALVPSSSTRTDRRTTRAGACGRACTCSTIGSPGRVALTLTEHERHADHVAGRGVGCDLRARHDVSGGERRGELQRDRRPRQCVLRRDLLDGDARPGQRSPCVGERFASDRERRRQREELGSREVGFEEDVRVRGVDREPAPEPVARRLVVGDAAGRQVHLLRGLSHGAEQRGARPVGAFADAHVRHAVRVQEDRPRRVGIVSGRDDRRRQRERRRARSA